MSKLLAVMMLAVSFNAAAALSQEEAIKVYGSCEVVTEKLVRAEAHLKELNYMVDIKQYYRLAYEREVANHERAVYKIQQEDVCGKQWLTF